MASSRNQTEDCVYSKVYNVELQNLDVFYALEKLPTASMAEWCSETQSVFCHLPISVHSPCLWCLRNNKGRTWVWSQTDLHHLFPRAARWKRGRENCQFCAMVGHCHLSLKVRRWLCQRGPSLLWHHTCGNPSPVRSSPLPFMRFCKTTPIRQMGFLKTTTTIN